MARPIPVHATDRRIPLLGGVRGGFATRHMTCPTHADVKGRRRAVNGCHLYGREERTALWVRGRQDRLPPSMPQPKKQQARHQPNQPHKHNKNTPSPRHLGHQTRFNHPPLFYQFLAGRFIRRIQQQRFNHPLRHQKLPPLQRPLYFSLLRTILKTHPVRLQHSPNLRRHEVILRLGK